MNFTGRRHLTFLLLLLFPLPAAAADPFADFRIPEHRVFSWTGNFSAGAGQGDFGASNVSSRSGSVSGSLGSGIFWLRDSDSRLSSLSIQSTINGTRAGNKLKALFEDERIHDRRTSESWAISSSQRIYPWRPPIGLDLVASGFANYEQNWENERSVMRFFQAVSDRRRSATTQRYDYEVRASAELGAGRVRDATAAYDVRVFEYRMRARGVLKGPLSTGTRNQLAQLYYNRANYYSVLERPGRSFWAQAVEILQRDPNYSRELDAVSLLRALEPYFGRSDAYAYDFLPRSPVLRRRGAFVGVAAQLMYNHFIQRSTSSVFIQDTVDDTSQSVFSSEDSQRFAVDQHDLQVGPTLEWHRPLSLRWQADVSSSLLIPTRGPARAVRFVSRGTLQWIVADRWLASALFSHVRQSTIDSWSVGYGASLVWYLEDHLRLGISASGGQSSQGDFFTRSNEVSVNMGYRFAGRLETPRLAEPIRVP
jgi:hypothetical protein